MTRIYTQLVARVQTAKSAQNDEGATAVEYGLMVALIAAVIVGVVATLGTTLEGKFQDVVDAITP